MRIAVCGLGYVGTVSAACFARDGHHVIGADVDPGKVDAINRGHSPVIEAGLEELVAEGVKAGRLRAVADARTAIAGSDLALVCVGTPSRLSGALDLQYVERIAREIGEAIAHGNPKRFTIVFRSTVLPGTVEGNLIPIVERAAGRKVGPTLGIAMNPEFLREGSAIKDFYDPPKTVIGQADDQVGEEVAALYADLKAPVERVPIRIAELVKYADNAFHGLKVAFANEIGNVAREAGVDSAEVMRIFCLDTKLNLSPAYLRPGFAFGGSCLPKDLRALTHHARRADVSVPLLESILASNEEQKLVGLRLVQRWGKKRIGLLGLAFKAGTDDLRESPMVELVESLLGKGYDIRVFDRNVAFSRLVGSNLAYIERELPHLGSLMVDTVGEVLNHAEVVVVGNSDPEFAAALEARRAGQIVVDLVRLAGVSKGARDYYGLSW